MIRIIKGNPMLLLLLVGVIITLGGPKLMASLDPEAFAEVSARQADSNKMLQNFQGADLSGSLSKYLAGGASVPANAPSAVVEKVQPTAAAGTTPSKKGGKKKK